ncbi:rRNA maturation RNase YbeY [Alkalilimnicola ehrlichii]|uniref:rRNA maturation RNase YbeY n=1 Tax=Alkalilimnicola ehrlichii TaxID=351052 RepID=UPI003BA24202
MTAAVNDAPALDLEVQYVVAWRAGLPPEAAFRRWVSVALAAGGHTGPAALAVRVVDKAEGRRLNHDYRGKDYPTNVLSFPFEAPPGLDEPLPELGDLVICAPVVEREAREQGKPEADHWAHLVVHGVLHLLGYDHEAVEEAEQMEGLERRILAGLGIADPYRLDEQ